MKLLQKEMAEQNVLSKHWEDAKYRQSLVDFDFHSQYYPPEDFY
jgi:hypothetical protein